MMKIFAETKRLILREFLPTDDEGLYLLDADPETHAYLGTEPITTIEEAKAMIQFIRKQYVENGIGRWTVIEKETGRFIGWSGLKLIKEETNHRIDYYDLGYRFIKSYWGRGYATEAAQASLDFAFNQLDLSQVFAMANASNIASQKVLEKVGFKSSETFTFKEMEHHWLVLEREEWAKKRMTPEWITNVNNY